MTCTINVWQQVSTLLYCSNCCSKKWGTLWRLHCSLWHRHWSIPLQAGRLGVCRFTLYLSTLRQIIWLVWSYLVCSLPYLDLVCLKNVYRDHIWRMCRIDVLTLDSVFRMCVIFNSVMFTDTWEMYHRTLHSYMEPGAYTISRGGGILWTIIMVNV